MKRRSFCKTLSAAITAAALGMSALPGCVLRPAGRLRILVLGGTNFVGPHIVRTSLRRGHEVTLFNRGVTNTNLFPELELLEGNRHPDRDEGLTALEGTRRWDAVVDTWQAEPGCVDATARLLSERTDRYLYVSSVATYRNYREVGMTEAGPFLDASEHVSSFDPELGYAMRKRAGEEAVEAAFGDRATVLICTSVLGPSDSARAEDAGTAAGYWPYRFLIGEPLLAPDDPTATFQLIDVRDLAEFAIRTLEHDLGGAYNLVGPEEPLLLREYLEAWSEATNHRSPIVWADPVWLRDQGVRPWDDIRNWIPGTDPEPGFYRISNRKALAHGLTYRPLQATIRDGLSGIGDPRAFAPPTEGLSREQELDLIERWRARTEPPVEALLRLHHEHRAAHNLGDADRFVATLADPLIETVAGARTERSASGSARRFAAYFSAARFLEWEDMAPPVIRLSGDGGLATVRVEKRVRVLLGAEAPSIRHVATHSSWTGTWRREAERWWLAKIESTEERLPEADGVPVAARVDAYGILHAAREALGGPAAVASVSTLAFLADCDGPRGTFVTRVHSARDGRVACQQAFPDRPGAGLGVSLAGPWRGPDEAAALSAAELGFLRGHEFHLLAIAPESRFRGPRARGRESIAGVLARTVRFSDPDGRDVAFFYHPDTGLPLGFRILDSPGPEAAGVTALFAEWRPVGPVRLPFEVTIRHGDEVFRYRVTEASTEWLADVAFRPSATQPQIHRRVEPWTTLAS